MKHIAKHVGNLEVYQLGVGVCGNPVTAADSFVVGALESDCDACRAKLLVGPMKQKGCELREPLSYTPEPMTGIESAEEIQRKRDGR